MIRRCSYNPKTVNTAVKLLKATAFDVNAMPTESVEDLITRFDASNIIDAIWFNHINADTAMCVPDDIKERLYNLAKLMLSHKPFSILTIHDAYRCSPVNANQMRKHYREIMAELAESTLLDDILTQITKRKQKIPKESATLGKDIRNSIYAIC